MPKRRVPAPVESRKLLRTESVIGVVEEGYVPRDWGGWVNSRGTAQRKDNTAV